MREEWKVALDAAGADVDGAMERFMGNEALYVRFARGFVKDRNYETLLQALSADDLRRAFEAAHTLKGVAGNLSFLRLYEEASRVVEPLRAGEKQEALAALPGLAEAYRAVIQALEEWEP